LQPLDCTYVNLLRFYKDIKLVIQKEVEITNKVGVHVRPASLIVEIANKFKSKIWIEKDGQKVDAKSVTGLLLLSAGKGSRVKVKAEGSDAQESVDALVKIIKDKFGEE